MSKPDELVAEIGQFMVFRKSDSREYEIIGPSVQNSPIAYTMIRATPESLEKILLRIRAHSRLKK